MRVLTTLLEGVQAMCKYCRVFLGVASCPCLITLVYSDFVSFLCYIAVFISQVTCIKFKSICTTNSLSTLIISVVKLLYPARSRRGTYRGCSRRDEARTSG